MREGDRLQPEHPVLGAQHRASATLLVLVADCDRLFYPDFVCELLDGRVLAVEYKGEPYKTNDDSREKVQIGEQWEKTSGGRCLFLMAVARNDKGHGAAQQIADKIAGE